MGAAYTPGLKVSPRTTIEKMRRLPLKGEVVVKVGDRVAPSTVVARTELPGILQTVKLAEQIGVDPSELPGLLRVKVGDRIEKGDVLAQSRALFGLIKSDHRATVSGVLEMISEQTGHLGIRQPPTPIEKNAYIEGEVTEVIEGEGVIVRCEGALIQGIFGVGGERQGVIRLAVGEPSAPLRAEDISEEHRGAVLVGGSCVSLDALARAAEVGAAGIVTGGVVDRDLVQWLRDALGDPGFDIGVAITGHEPIALTLVVTEGFGSIRMANRTFALLESLEGRTASINGATQIRAGVIRPEIIVPLEPSAGVSEALPSDAGELRVGTPIRVIREPYFGILGTVTRLPSELVKVESETMVRVLEAKLEDGRDAVVPRANVEIIETA